MKKLLSTLCLVFLLVAMVSPGCSTVWPKSKKPKTRRPIRGSLIGDYASPGQSGLSSIKIEGFALVENLNGHGCLEPDTPQRQRVVEEFKKAGVEKYQQRIDSPDTAIVYVHSYLRPGIQKGDPVDVHVQLPPSSNADSLKNGIILVSCPLIQHWNGRDSFPLARVKGPVLLELNADPKTNPDAEKSGYILGQAICNKDRGFTLIINDEDKSVYTAKEIQDRINARFKIPNEPGGVAEAKTDTRIDLKLHPAYRDAVFRYLQVVLSIGCFENITEQEQRMGRLKTELLDPDKSQLAALQLEAIGKRGMDVLREGLKSQNADVRFYSAESLAYLGIADAAKPLMTIAKTDLEHRFGALNALGTMKNDMAAEQSLQELLMDDNPVTRYGAFRALWHRNPLNPTIRGEQLGNEKFTFSYHVLNIPGTPMVHVTKSKRSEIVLFSPDIRLQTPFVLSAGNKILVKSEGTNRAVVTRLAPGGISEMRTVGTSLNEIIRAIAELEGTYPDVVQFLCSAEKEKNLTCALKLDVFAGGEEEDRDLLVGTAHDDDTQETKESKKKTAWQKLNPVSLFSSDKSEKSSPSISKDDGDSKKDEI